MQIEQLVAPHKAQELVFNILGLAAVAAHRVIFALDLVWAQLVLQPRGAGAQGPRGQQVPLRVLARRQRPRPIVNEIV
ncbi:MAG: hypothetical protein K6T71_07260, partial [Candidatus Bipolaricaulota bacterium]|nr:hypothetical protein [Candidatus Bipolaricaulota bacterium]